MRLKSSLKFIITIICNIFLLAIIAQNSHQQAPLQQPSQQAQAPLQPHHQSHQFSLLQVQQNQQSYHEQHQQHSLASSMQQVLLDASNQQYHVAYTQIAWKHESTDRGEVNEFYMHNYESSYPVSTQGLVAYHQIHHLEQQQQQLQQQQQQQHHHHHHQQQPQHHPHQQQPQQQHHHHQQHHNQQHQQPQPQPHQQHPHHYDEHNHHEYQHLMYSGQYYDDHDYDINSRPSGSCETENPSMLMQPILGEPTCRASSSLDNADSSQNVPNFSHLANKPSHNSNVESSPLAPHHYHYESSLISAIRHYWREVSGLCLASAIFLNWLFVVIKRRFVINGITCNGITCTENAIETTHQSTTRSVSKDTNSSSAHDSAFEETASPICLEDVSSSKSSTDPRDRSSQSVKELNISTGMRQRSSTLKVEPIPIPSSPGHNSLTASISNSLNSSEYLSRYSSDFDSIQRLGRGGFGIVFEARNKIDDCHYAVKRICLPLEKEARERVMREVRALAKLDHAGIVRYYNAWLETPPDEWLKQHDAQLGIVHSKDGLGFPSTDGIYDRNESEHITRGNSESKLGESGDNSSGVFGNGPFKRRTNGLRRLLKNNSSSPSLDIVFEGSGSIRLESENNTEKTDSSKGKRNTITCNGGDNNSDSEDSDFIQFESRGNKKQSARDKSNNGDDEISISSHLTDPFSSSSDSDAERKDSSQNRAIKKAEMETRKKALIYQRELRQLNNASLVENLHVEKVYLYIQMQLCRKDTLKDWLKTNCENRDKTTIFDLFYQIVDAVEYVHSQDLIHRDLKPSNIFFSLDGTLKIGDFGLCRAKTSAGIGSSLDLQEYVAESDVERGFEAVHTEQVGTQLYMSPEQLNGLSYNQKVDIFAMGLILLELLVPFKTQMQRVNVLFKARNNLYLDEFRNNHPKEHELVRTLLSRSPQKRPTATEIKQHELLASAQLSQPVIERIYHRRRTISSNSSTE